MTRDELLETLRRLAEYADAEIAHSQADRALVEFINDDAITKAYDAICKWYA